MPRTNKNTPSDNITVGQDALQAREFANLALAHADVPALPIARRNDRASNVDARCSSGRHYPALLLGTVCSLQARAFLSRLRGRSSGVECFRGSASAHIGSRC